MGCERLETRALLAAVNDAYSAYEDVDLTVAAAEGVLANVSGVFFR
jgi:hypothetical protein